MTFPTLSQALDIYSQQDFDEMHSLVVAFNASVIASCCGLDPLKSYILGLLHDYGQVRCEDNPDKFHGTAGYDIFMDYGYPDCARIALTHSFPNKDFLIEDFVYPRQELLCAKDLMQKIVYDDYDRLIQLSDLLVNDHQPTSLKQRMSYIKGRYKVSMSALRRQYKGALRLKNYFDKKCGQNIYHLLGISDD